MNKNVNIRKKGKDIRFRWLRTLQWLGVLLLTVPFVSIGQEVDLLVSPGKLSNVHKEFSGMKNCIKCHTAGKKTDSAKCLACHKDLAVRVNAGKGYHRDKKEECITCHPEHNGESFNLIEWDPLDFDHSDTGYALTGLHKKVTSCDKCHTSSNSPVRKSSKTYLLEDTRCIACHRDVHQGRLGSDCGKCHNVDTPFREAVNKFDHVRTSFPLNGAHAQVTCEKCHKEKKWSGLKFSTCQKCHQDPHRPSFKRSCNTCHNEDSWKVSRFDHNLTRYPLRGKHQTLACAKCHPPGKESKKMAFANCSDCHSRDPHEGQFQKDCKSCHVVEGFKKLIFDHKTSRYLLTGKHKSVDCRKCHYAGKTSHTVRYKPLGTTCIDCHQDIHLGQFEKKCTGCHTTEGFKRELLTFRHQTDSNYPLTGKHLEVSCEKCHTRQKRNYPGGVAEAVLYRPIAGTCSTCHNDIHRGQLGTDCEKCHNYNGFKPATGFDHQKTRFSLKGFHETIECRKCHPPVHITSGEKTIKTVTYKPVSTACMDCHRNFDHSRTAFPLTGKHRNVDCRHCHNAETPNVSKVRKTQKGSFQCRRCHKSPHPGNQPNCADCHTTKNWRVEAW